MTSTPLGEDSGIGGSKADYRAEPPTATSLGGGSGPVLLERYCAKSEVNTYSDGSTWDFSGHNAFYGPFEYSSK